MFRQAIGESPSTYARTAVKPAVREALAFEDANDTDEFAATGSD
jgi:hypothetical protein